MKHYNVIITRDTTESTTVDVEADSPKEALIKALGEAQAAPNDFDWVQDDEYHSMPYLPDDSDEAAEEVTPEETNGPGQLAQQLDPRTAYRRPTP